MSPIVQPRQRLVPAGRLAVSRPALTRAVGAFGRSRPTDDPAVAASLFAPAWAVSVTRAAIAGRRSSTSGVRPTHADTDL